MSAAGTRTTLHPPHSEAESEETANAPTTVVADGDGPGQGGGPRHSIESTTSIASAAALDIGRSGLSSQGSREADPHINGSPTPHSAHPNGTDIPTLLSRIATLQSENSTLRTEKHKSDSAYNSLLHKVSDIRKSLTARFQQNEAALQENAETIARLETENTALKDGVETLQSEIEGLSTENSLLSTQITSLRREMSSLQSREAEWNKDRTKQEKTKRTLEAEIDTLRREVVNWERTASEEHIIAESSRDRILLLEEEILSYRDHQSSARGEAERAREEAENVRRTLREVQEERKRELREVVDGMEGQIERLNGAVERAEKRAVDAEGRLEENLKELERLNPFEAEVKEKAALLGKTRHEAVILNEHLTKALRLLKRASPSSTVDKQVMTNFLLQFLSLPREDTKRYEILNLIASILEWGDEQRQKAGLAKAPHLGGNVRRTNSNPLLADLPMSAGDRKESMSELWINFLQKEAESRTDSTGDGVTSPTEPGTSAFGGSAPATPSPSSKK